MKLPKPPPDDGTRAEFEAFLTGVSFVLEGIKRAFPQFEANKIWQPAIEAAIALYPPFDPPPTPVKATGDGIRADGLVMSED